MTSELQSRIEDYLTWVRDRTSTRTIGDWIEITTPLLDRHNDALQIYVKPQGQGYLLTDGGHIVSDLEIEGFTFDTPRRKQLLQMTLNGFGVRLADDRIEVVATKENFPLKKHSLLQAMITVNDLFYMASPRTASVFVQDVATWLDANDVRYTPDVKFTGKSGLDHVFNFIIPRSRQSPERVIRALARPDRPAAESFVFAWTDTREYRVAGTEAIAILNDQERDPSQDVRSALQAYEISSMLWSSRVEHLQRLLA